MIRPRLAPLLACGLFTLSGCVSLLPKSRPAQLYRFGEATAQAPSGAAGAAAGPAAGPGAPPIGLTLAHIDMQRASAGDQILAVTGQEAAFIDGARWLSPASILFEAAVQDGFAAHAAHARLLDRAEFAASQGSLRLDVPTFETRYPSPGAAPTVRVRVRATLTARGGGVLADGAFQADVPAAADRVSAIVAAYDAAVAQVVSELVAWTDARAPLAAAPAPAPTSSRTTTRITRGAAVARP